MSKKMLRGFMLLLLAMSLLIAAGCQAVGGKDLNSMLSNAFKVTSSESKQSLSLKFDLNEDVLAFYDVTDTFMFSLLSDVKIELDQVRVADRDKGEMSFEGNVTLKDTKPIHFAAQLTNTLMSFQVDGAKQPFVIDLREYMDDEDDMELDLLAMNQFQLKVFEKASSLFIGHLPNPKTLTVEPVTEKINGIDTSLFHVHTEFDGEELWKLAKGFLDSLLKDREGITAFMTELFTLFEENAEIAYWLEGFYDSSELDAPTKEEMIKEAVEELIEEVSEFRKEMDKSSVSTVMMQTFINKNLKLEADLYFDDKLDMRKQDIKLSLDFANGEDAAFIPFGKIELTSASEMWNVNGEVKADKPIVTKDSVDLIELDYMEGFEVVKLFEEDSFIYDLLKNKLHITKQEYYAFNDEYNAPVMMPGYITLVPIRDVAYAFGAETSYDAKTKTITLNDIATGTIIKTQVGSDIAIVNGKEVKWSFPTTIIDSTGYVAARSLSDALEAKIEWTTIYEDIKMLVIEREL